MDEMTRLALSHLIDVTQRRPCMASVAYSLMTLGTPLQGLLGSHWLLSIDATAAEFAAPDEGHIKHRFDEGGILSYLIYVYILTS